MNAAFEVIKNRYSCRNFGERQVPNEDLELLAESAVRAPSGRNLQPWHIIVVRDRELIAGMDAATMSYLAAQEDQAAYQRILGRGGKVFYNAGAMIFIMIDPKDHLASAMDCGIVVENIALAATGLGIDNVICGMAAFVFESDNAEHFKETLKIPAGFIFGTSILLGYAPEKGTQHEPDFSKIHYIG